MRITPAAITVPNLQAIDNVLPGVIRKLDESGIKLDSPAAFLAGIGTQSKALDNLRKGTRLTPHVHVSFLMYCEDADEVLYIYQNMDCIIEELDYSVCLITASLYAWIKMIVEDIDHTKEYKQVLANAAAIIEMAGFKECFYDYTKSVDVDGITVYR